MTERFFAERGLYYRTNTFVPGRQTLVFVHGVSGSSSAWKAYESRFEAHYNLLTFDLRGHGRSTRYPREDDYAIANFVDDLKALLQLVAVDTCLVIGHSFAVLIILEFLHRYQSRVEGVILVSAHYDMRRDRLGRIAHGLLGWIGLLERLPFHPHSGGHIDYARYPNAGDWNIPRTLADARNTTWRVLLYCLKAASTVSGDAFLPEIGVPVLLVHGKRDTIISITHATYMATRIPTAHLVVLEDANHILVLNRPREVGDAIEAFVQMLSNEARARTASPC